MPTSQRTLTQVVPGLVQGNRLKKAWNLPHSLPGGQGGCHPEWCAVHTDPGISSDQIAAEFFVGDLENILAEGVPLQGQWSRHLKDMRE